MNGSRKERRGDLYSDVSDESTFSSIRFMSHNNRYIKRRRGFHSRLWWHKTRIRFNKLHDYLIQIMITGWGIHTTTTSPSHKPSFTEWHKLRIIEDLSFCISWWKIFFLGFHPSPKNKGHHHKQFFPPDTNTPVVTVSIWSHIMIHNSSWSSLSSLFSINEISSIQSHLLSFSSSPLSFLLDVFSSFFDCVSHDDLDVHS